jgi:hypothetical protein
MTGFKSRQAIKITLASRQCFQSRQQHDLVRKFQQLGEPQHLPDSRTRQFTLLLRYTQLHLPVANCRLFTGFEYAKFDFDENKLRPISCRRPGIHARHSALGKPICTIEIRG